MNSSNYHYRNRLVRATIVNETENANENEELDYCTVSVDDPRIPQSVLQEQIDQLTDDTVVSSNLLETLYDVTMGVRYLKRTEYSEIEIAKRTRDRYDELQIKFAMNEMTEKEWEQQVYKTHIKQQSYELIAGILHIYLANMDGIQSELYHLIRSHLSTGGVNREKVNREKVNREKVNREKVNRENITKGIEDIHTKIERLTSVVNENIEEIRQEYDATNTTVLRIRSVGQTDMGFCSKHTVLSITNKKTTMNKKTTINQKATINGGQGQGQGEGEENKKEKAIELYPYQIEHVERLQGFLEKYHFAIDLSPLGTGKTFSAAKIFQLDSTVGKYRHLITISPPSVKTKWMEVDEDYGLYCRALLTYGEITGRRFSNPKCGYMIRNDYKVPILQENGTVRMIDKYNYKTTQLFEHMVEEGVLLVLDEFQHLKNECAQTEACETLIKSIFANFTRGGKSRVLLMSGSPMDKEEQVVRLFKTLGIMQHDKIVSGFQHAGINEIVQYIDRTFESVPGSRENRFIRQTANSIIRISYDDAGNRIYRQYGISSMRYAYRIFIEVIKPCASSTMDLMQMQQSNVTLHKFNGYFHINETHNIERVNRAVAELQEIRNLQARIRMRRTPANQLNEATGENQETESGTGIMSQLSRALIAIETAKIETFVRLIQQELRADERRKVVIGVNYTQTIADIVEQLADYSPLVIDGGKTIASRRGILAKFQAPTTEHRLLIGNISVISTGIDLDDKHGDFPRTCFVSPNYNTIHIYQLGHRFLRGMDTKSDTRIYMVYGKNPVERRIMESLMQKGEIMKQVTIEQSRAGVIFPSNYEAYYEEN